MKRIVMIIMAVALIALPTMAQDWQSTSSMQGSGSNYSSQVTAVGATDINSLATTTESYSPSKAPGGPRKDKIGGPDANQSTESPIGDAVLPMLLCAAVFCGVIAIRRKRNALNR